MKSFLWWLIKTSNYIQVLIQQMAGLTHFFKNYGIIRWIGDLLEFFKMFLILFHCQSVVERRFSVKKQLLVEKNKTQSLVELWRIEDHMYFSELSPETIKISNELIKSVKEAHRCCSDESERQKKRKSSKNF